MAEQWIINASPSAVEGQRCVDFRESVSWSIKGNRPQKSSSAAQPPLVEVADIA